MNGRVDTRGATALASGEAPGAAGPVPFHFPR